MTRRSRIFPATIPRFAPSLALAAVLVPLLACSQVPGQAALDDLMRRADFQQCLRYSGIAPSQISRCVAVNPDEPSARACIETHLGANQGPQAKALDRCYNLGSQPAYLPPGTLTCSSASLANSSCH